MKSEQTDSLKCQEEYATSLAEDGGLIAPKVQSHRQITKTQEPREVRISGTTNNQINQQT